MTFCIPEFVGIYGGYGVSGDIDSAAVIQNIVEICGKQNGAVLKRVRLWVARAECDLEGEIALLRTLCYNLRETWLLKYVTVPIMNHVDVAFFCHKNVTE